jgi:uncharacterized membrane protein YidH (DUF202 family)
MDQQIRSARSRDHLANERTFLAWIRTSVGIIALGFVVEKFTLFLKEVTEYFTQKGENAAPSSEWFSDFGIFLIAVGALIGLLAFISFKKTQRQIEENRYEPGWTLGLALTILIVASGAFLAVYLLTS